MFHRHDSVSKLLAALQRKGFTKVQNPRIDPATDKPKPDAWKPARSIARAIDDWQEFEATEGATQVAAVPTPSGFIVAAVEHAQGYGNVLDLANPYLRVVA